MGKVAFFKRETVFGEYRYDTEEENLLIIPTTSDQAFFAGSYPACKSCPGGCKLHENCPKINQ